MTLITPSLLRNQLDENKTIEFQGYITRRLDRMGRIELQLNISELTNQQANKFSEEDVKRLEILNKKISTGLKDLDTYLQKNLYENKVSRIDIIIGKAGIIDTDIKKALKEGVAFYDLQFHRINLSSPAEISGKIKQLEAAQATVIAVARGGGENLEVFDKLKTCEAALSSKAIIISAIGHAENVTLFEKIADKKFITPTDLGNYLVNLYNDYTAALQQSKAKMVKDVTDQLKASYEKQLQVAGERSKSLEDLLNKNKQVSTEQREELVRLQKAEKENLLQQLSLDQKKVENERKLLAQRVEVLTKDLSSRESQVSESVRQQQRLQDNVNQLNKRVSELSNSGSRTGVYIVVIILIVVLLLVSMSRK
jgi:exonuclease VII large subunit